MAPRIFRPNFALNRYDELPQRDAAKQYKMLLFPGFPEASYIELTDAEQQQRDKDAAAFLASATQAQPMDITERVQLLEQMMYFDIKKADINAIYKNRLGMSDGYGKTPKS